VTAPVVLRLGKQLTSLEYTTDDTERGSRLAPIGAQHAGKSTFLGMARFRLVSSDDGPQTVILEDPEVPDGGPIGFDDQLVGKFLLREKTAETFEVTATDFETQELELAMWPGVDFEVGEWFQFREDEPETGLVGTGNGRVPYHLDHPVYVAPTDPGIGVKFRTIDRNTLIGLPQLVPNGWLTQWSDPDELPDGFSYYALSPLDYFGLPPATPPYNPAVVTFAKNTDSLYTELGGQSLYFSAATGTIVTPPVPYMPTYEGQRLSLRFRVYLTQFSHFGDTIRVVLGLMKADGTIKPFAGALGTSQNQLWIVPATSFRAAATTLYKTVGTNGWANLDLLGIDISTGNDTGYGVEDADITDPTNLGFVAIIDFRPGSSAQPIQGYLDAAVIVPSSEVPGDLKLFGEFGRANTLWQDTQMALSVIAPPQEDIRVSLVDLYELNPTLNAADQIVQGGRAIVAAPSLGLVNTAGRFTKVEKNQLVKGDILVEITTRRRFLAQFFNRGGGSSVGGTTGTPGTTTTPTPPVTPPVTPPLVPPTQLSAPLLTLTLDDDNIPTVVANVTSNVNRVKFAWSLTGVPADEEVRAATSVTPAPFTATTDAIGDGETIWVAAFAYDVTSNAESLKGWTSISAPIFTPAIPWLFAKPGVNQFEDRAGTTPAGNGDDLGRWEDANDNGRAIVAEAVAGSYDFIGTVDAGAVYCGLNSSGDQAGFHLPDMSAFTKGVIMVRLKQETTPGDNKLWLMNRIGFASEPTLYPHTDGHIYDSWGAQAATDFGEPGIPLNAWHTYEVVSSPTVRRARINGAILYEDTATPPTPFFHNTPRLSGIINTTFWDGRIEKLAVWDFVPAESQLQEWRDYFDGTTDVAPTDAPEESAISFTHHFDGGDVIVTATARFASSVKIAADLVGIPSDATVRAAPELTERPFSATFPAPLEGETLHVAAFAYYSVLGDLESGKATYDIEPSTGDISTEAEFILAAVDDSLPNARVGTDSDSTAWDYSVDNEVKVHVKASGVVADTYGTGTAIPQITVGSDGRITDVTEIAVGGAAHAIGASFDGAGEPLTLDGTTKVRVGPVQIDGAISIASILGQDGPGDITIGVKACAVGSYPGSLADITGGNDLELTADHYIEDSTLAGWTLDVDVGDVFEFELKAVDGVLTQATILLTVI
jgi:hypothetical protein